MKSFDIYSNLELTIWNVCFIIFCGTSILISLVLPPDSIQNNYIQVPFLYICNIFMRNYYSIFHSGGPSLHSHQNEQMFPHTPNPYQLSVINCVIDPSRPDRCKIKYKSSFKVYFLDRKEDWVSCKSDSQLSVF